MIRPDPDRLERARAALSLESGLAFITDRADIRWLSGFSGSNALLVLGTDSAHLFTDGRYTEQARLEVVGASVQISSGPLGDHAAEVLPELGASEIGFQADHLTVSAFEHLRDLFPEASFRALGSLRTLRARKSAAELDCISRALAISETVFENLVDDLREGTTELEIAAQIDHLQRLAGAEGPAFETIVAMGAQAAFPHAKPGRIALKRGQPLLLDFGCVVEGYRSDITRMVCLGQPPDGFREVYAVVEAALEAAIRQARAGMTGREIDQSARTVIEDAGYGEAFSHSLGHGVGLETHEWPTVSQRGEDAIPRGSVITIEPGVYLAGRFGIRIENMVVLGKSSARVLNRTATGLLTI